MLTLTENMPSKKEKENFVITFRDISSKNDDDDSWENDVEEVKLIPRDGDKKSIDIMMKSNEWYEHKNLISATTELSSKSWPTNESDSSSAIEIKSLETSAIFEYKGFAFSEKHISSPYFSSSIAFLNQIGIEEFKDSQLKMLDQLLKGNNFQALTNCGSGKSFLVLFGFTACLSEDHTLIFVYDRESSHQQLRDQTIKMLLDFSGGGMPIVDIGSSATETANHKHVRDVDISTFRAVLSPCRKLSQVLEKVHGKVVLVFDECQSIFFDNSKFLENIEESISSIKERCQIVCLSAVGNITNSRSQADSFIQKCLGQDTEVEVVVNAPLNAAGGREGGGEGGSTVSLLHETYIVHMHDHEGIYEQIVNISMTYLTSGRNILICRPQQVGVLVDYISNEYPHIRFTSNREHWQNPKYKIVLVREDELKELEGLNLEDLTSVYLLTISPILMLFIAVSKL